MATILVVDDDDSILRLLATTLTDLGEVVTVRDGDEAIAWTDQQLPDIVVLDVSMPGRSGLDVLAAWRGDARTAELDVVLLSGRDEAGDQRAGYAAGADAYVTKPVDIDTLQGLLGAMLAQRREREQELLQEFRNLSSGDFSELG